jgi:hypothetical protein
MTVSKQQSDRHQIYEHAGKIDRHRQRLAALEKQAGITVPDEQRDNDDRE